MNNNRNLYNTSNEQQLVSILNRMYNDNITQINRHSASINSLNASNIEIRNFIVQILSNVNANVNNINNSNNRRNNRSSQRNTLFRDNSFHLPLLNNLRGLYIDTTNNNVIPSRNASRENSNFSRILQSFFTPVEVYPTQSQIESATRRVTFSDIESPRNRNCPISLENFNDSDIVTIITYCGHIFNTEQLNTWFESHCICPVCRYDIRDNNSTSRDFFQNSINSDLSNNVVNNTNENEIINTNVDTNVDTNTNNNERINTNRSRDTRGTSPYLITLFMDIIGENGASTDISNNYISNSEFNTLISLINSFQGNSQ